MANIMINDVCNLKCPYCFANEYVNGDTSTDITYKNFKKAVDWINNSNMNNEMPERIALIGGEPLLHPQLDDMIKYASSVRLPMQEILVFTNGLRLDKYADLFARFGVSLLINLNSPEDMGIDRYEKTINNIRLARMKGVNVSVGINFYKKDLDTKFILDVVDEFRLKDLRIGVTAPNTPEKKEKGAFSYFKEIVKPLVAFKIELAKRGCDGHFDCQKIPVCIMKEYEKQLMDVERKTGVPCGNIIECSACTPVLDILTDLTVVRCFGVSERKYGVPMEAFNNQQEVFDYFRTNYDNFGYFFPTAEECINCKERAIGRCQGGCLSFKIQDIEKAVTRPNNIKALSSY